MGMSMAYLTQPPKRYTFEQPKLREWVETFCYGKVLNLFAGRTMLDVDEFRVDVDPEMPADAHMDAWEFVRSWQGEAFDVVVLDPPYNIRKSREKYGDRWIGSFTKIKNELPRIVKGRVITLGYDTVGMSKSRGFEKIAVAVVCHGGDHNDTLVVVEERQDGTQD